MDTPTRSEATAVAAGPADRPDAARSVGSAGRRAAWALGLGAAAIAYRDLLWLAPRRSLSEEIERLFFLPSQGVAPLIVLLAAWLLYRRSARLRRLPAAQAPWLGSACLGAGALLQLWATLASAPDLLAPSLGLVGCGVAALWKGRAAARVVLLPALFLLFAMPLPAPLLGEVLLRLQIATADLSGVFLGMLGITHHVAGDQILRPQQTFSVIETCSGLRSIETLTIVAILMADLFGRRGWHALLLVAAAPPLAFFVNGWRSVALILNPYSQIVTVHTAQGVAMLLVGLLLLSLLDGLAERLGRRLGAGRAGERTPRGPRAPRAERPQGSRAAPLAAAGVLGALAVASLLHSPAAILPPEPLRLEAGFPGLPSQELPTDRVFLGSAGFREVATRRYQRGGHGVDVFLGVGWRPGRARSARSPKTALPGSGWILEDEQFRTLAPDDRVVRRLVLRSGTQSLLVYHWYEGDAGLAVETIRSLLALDSSPLGGGDDILAVRMATPIDGPLASGLEPAAARLDELYADLREAIDRLPGRSGTRRGTAFLEFPIWVKLFHRTEPGLRENPERIRGVRVETGLGTRLARWTSCVLESADSLCVCRVKSRGRQGKLGEDRRRT